MGHFDNEVHSHIFTPSQDKFNSANTPPSERGKIGDIMELSISINEAARRTGVSRSSLYGAIQRGELPLVKVGRRSIIRTADLAKWVEDLPTSTLNKAA